MTMARSVLSILLSLLWTPAGLCGDSDYEFGTSITATDAQPLDEFGDTVHRLDNGVVVGGQGGAYIFEGAGVGYVQVAKMFDQPASASGYGNVAVAGAPTLDEVRIFEQSGGLWQQSDSFKSNTPGEAFGDAIAISDDKVFLVGAPQASAGVGKIFAGAAYFVEKVGGSWQQTRVVASDGASFASFGSSVAILGDLAVIGADGANIAQNGPGGVANYTSAGAAYVFRRSGGVWALVKKLEAPAAGTGDRFGRSIAIMDDKTILVGAPYTDHVGVNQGTMYEFTDLTSGSWQATKVLESPDKPAGFGERWFGFSISTFGEFVAVGSPNDQRGVAHVFERKNNAYEVFARLEPETPGTNSIGFGHAVSVSSGRLVVGCPFDSQAGNLAGSLHVFSQPVYGLGCPGSLGVPTLRLVNTFQAGAIAITANDVAPGSFGFLFLGTEREDLPVGFGCHLLVGPLPSVGVATLLIAPGSLLIAGAKPAHVASVTFNVQLFLLDPSLSNGFAATNGLEF